jgi:hypothetical protein
MLAVHGPGTLYYPEQKPLITKNNKKQSPELSDG